MGERAGAKSNGSTAPGDLARQRRPGPGIVFLRLELGG
jgi:hypothetical protein